MPTREIFWNISISWLLYPLFLIALAICVYGFYRRYRLWLIGQRENRVHKVGQRLKDLLVYAFGQKRVVKKLFPAIMHTLIFFGFLVLVLTTLVVAIQEDLHIALFEGNLYLILKVAANSAGVLVLLGLALAFWRRFIKRPDGLDNQRGDGLSLLLIALILITGFFVQGLRIAAQADPWAGFAYVGYAMAPFLQAVMVPQDLLLWHRILWWVHLVLAMSFIAYIPYSKLSHMVLGPAAQFLRKQGPIGVPDSIDFEDETLESFGKNHLDEFSWKLGYDTDVCVRCGRCQDNCPAHLSDKHLNPKQVLQDLQKHMEKVAQSKSAGTYDENDSSNSLIGLVLPEDDIWACTTCRSCEEQCPFFLEHVDKMIELRRYLVLTESRFPSEVQLAFRNLETNGNPWGLGWDSRCKHLQSLGVPLLDENPKPEVLFWPGCSGAYDQRSQKVSEAIVGLLQAAQVNLSFIGNDEKCCGDPARRLGNEYLFATLALENNEILNASGVKKIITQCPHCLHVLKEEYPAFGGNYEVIHYTEYLDELVKTERLSLYSEKTEPVIYHDSCYLGRYQGIFDEPRSLLKASGIQVVEVPVHNHEHSLCCGGGGGRMWMEEHEGTAICEIRAKEICATGVTKVATACPYCLTMLHDGMAALSQTQIETFDIAEILFSRLKCAQLQDLDE